MTAPLVVDITPLKRNPGTPLDVVLPDVPVKDLALESAEVHATRLAINARLESALEQMILIGEISVGWSGPCRRCLEDQAGTTTIDAHEIFEKGAAEGETYEMGENEIDIEPMVRETVLLNLPIAPLCREDCQGPDPDRFPASVAADTDPETDDHAAPSGDPRWAALDALEFD